MVRVLASFVCIIFLRFSCFAHSQMQSFRRTIQNATVDFELFPIRSPNFGILVQQSDASFQSFSAPSPRTYLGTIRDRPGAMASGLLTANGTLLCRISFENGVEWISMGNAFSIRGTTNWKPQWPTTSVPASNANAAFSVAEVGVDASYAEYLAAGSTILGTLDIVEFSVMAANIPFIRDASILHNIGKIVIRASQSHDPYTSTNTKPLLGQVRNQWNNIIAKEVGKTHNLALVVRPGAGGGLAYVGTVKNSWAYSSNGANSIGDFSVLWRHEAGHNWGSSHNEGGGRPEGPTIMSGNQLSRFSSSELVKILAYKSKISLPTVASFPRPPRANMDVASTMNQPQVSIDVLANDLDADFKGLKIISAENPSNLNGEVQVLNNKIVYTPSTAAVDYFSYRIRNVEGKTAKGYVMVRPDVIVGLSSSNISAI